MSKQDYVMIARLLNKWVDNESLRALLFVEFANEISKNHPRFRKDKWHEARESDAQRVKRIRAEHGLTT